MGSQRLANDIVIQILESVFLRMESLSIPEFLSFLLNILTAVGSTQENWSAKQILAVDQQVAVVLEQVCLIISLLPYKSSCVHIIGPSILFLLNQENLNVIQTNSLSELFSHCICCAQSTCSPADV